MLLARIEIVNDDVLNVPNIIKSANVLVMNNVFEWFNSLQDQERFSHLFLYIYIYSKLNFHQFGQFFSNCSPGIKLSMDGLKFVLAFILFSQFEFP